MRKKYIETDNWLTTVLGGETGPEFDVEAAYKDFASSRYGSERFARPAAGWLRPVLAAIALLLAAGSGYYIGGRGFTADRLAETVIEAPSGSNIKTTLPDGTVIWLNSESRLSYSGEFGIRDRNVSLSGEAFFDVTHNKDLPFTVSSGSMKAEVLGTMFNYKDYTEDRTAVVTLIKGKVRLSSSDESQTCELLPSQKCTFSKDDGMMRMEPAPDPSAVSAWIDGLLFFNEEPLADIAETLSRSYNADVRLSSDDLGQTRLFGVFARREMSLYEVLDALAATGKIRYRIDDDKTITLYDNDMTNN